MLPLSRFSEKLLWEKLLTPQQVSLGTARGEAGADLSALLSPHRTLCPCVIQPQDDSNELKQLVYFNRKYQVRHVAFSTGLTSSSCWLRDRGRSNIWGWGTVYTHFNDTFVVVIFFFIKGEGVMGAGSRSLQL